MGSQSAGTGLLKRRGRDTRDALAQRTGHVRSQWKGPSTSQGARLRRNQRWRYLDHGPMRKLIFVVWATQTVVLYYGSPTKTARKQGMCACFCQTLTGPSSPRSLWTKSTGIFLLLEWHEFGVQSMPGLVHGYNFSLSCSWRQLFIAVGEGSGLLLALIPLREQSCGPWGGPWRKVS